MPLPTELRLNAFTGDTDPGSHPHARAGRWAGQPIDVVARILHEPPGLVDQRQWLHADVGWGLVLPDDPDLDAGEKAAADDQPEPIRRLLAHRQGVVLRWSTDLPVNKLRRYYADGKFQDPDLVASPRGTAPGRLPRYLLLYGSPAVLPWALQYRLNAVAFTGRLDLDDAGLQHYVDAIIGGWQGQVANGNSAVTWAVDHGEPDITTLMRTVVAKRVHDALAGYSGVGAGAHFLDGRNASQTVSDLIAALAAHRPGLVISSSHGMTGPLDDVDAMRADLGLPVDHEYRVIDPDTLLDAWDPDGAIWYAHACCSAGSDARSAYEGLVSAGSHADQVLRGVAACGAMVAPLPRALLGARRPLRAFIGQVEPTFDWTLKDAATGQVLTTSIVDALYRHLYQPEPVGMALAPMHQKGPQLEVMHVQAKALQNDGEDRLAEVLALRLAAQDMMSLVLLGDPAEAVQL
jgi:hypothetical protein